MTPVGRAGCARRGKGPTRIACAIVLSLLPITLAAQPPAEHVGLTGGLYLAGRTILDAQGAPREDRLALFGIALGTRLQLLTLGGKAVPRALSITPQILLMATDIRGVDRGSPYAFALVDPSLQLTLRVHRHLRLYATVHAGQRTMERRDTIGVDSTTVNFWGGGGRGTSYGVEVPITREGRGFDIGWGSHRGRFTTKEWIDRAAVDDRDVPTNTPYKGTVLYLGWRGPFRGGWPWQ